MSGGGCRLVFVGAVEEGRRCLEAMLSWGESFAGLLTLTEAAAARTAGAVSFEDLARRHGVPLQQVTDPNHPANVERLRSLGPDLILAIGWTRLLGREVLSIPRLGCVGFHASLLPRYRGRAPVNWSLIRGEAETGNTMFFLDEGVDTGDVIAQRRIPIAEDDTCATLYRKMADRAIEMLAETLPLLKAGRAPRRTQDHARATVMPVRRPEDGVVAWDRAPRDLYNWVRALTHPYPGAFTSLDGRKLFVWEARPREERGREGAVPGTVVATAPGEAVVAARGGSLALRRVQWEGEEEADGSTLAGLTGRRLGERAGGT